MSPPQRTSSLRTLHIRPYLATFEGDRVDTVEVYAASEEEALARAKTFAFHVLHKREVSVSASPTP
jgi:hypothetical protein